MIGMGVGESKQALYAERKPGSTRQFNCFINLGFSFLLVTTGRKIETRQFPSVLRTFVPSQVHKGRGYHLDSQFLSLTYAQVRL